MSMYGNYPLTEEYKNKFRMNHKQWLDNEYSKWVKALQESTVHNFKEHPMVKRMLGEISDDMFYKEMYSPGFKEFELLQTIDKIGRSSLEPLTGVCLRMLYYARIIIELNPISIAEIGGGVGQFYAILRALGYKGTYYIYDLPEVELFQNDYLKEVSKQTGLNTTQKQSEAYDLCVSFYALGEFDDEWKAWYIENILSRCKRGFVIWNPHSSATVDVPFKCTITDEYPQTGENNKQLTW